VSGLKYATVLKHIKKGILPTIDNSRKHKIYFEDARLYCWDVWETGKFWMYHPDRFYELTEALIYERDN
jgi:hypothetical protein